MSNVSPHAVIEKGAEVAPDVRVGPFCYIGAGVKISPGCIIENNVTIVGRTVLGERNHVFPMSLIGACPGKAEGGSCILGDANAVREHVTVYGGDAEPTRIGSDNLVMIDCQIGGGAQIGDHCIFANCTQVGERACVEPYVQTSSFVAVEPGVTVGAYTFIVAFAGLDRNVPPYAMVQGFPFRVRGVNTQKLQRCAFTDEDIHALKDAFREIFNGVSEPFNEEALRNVAARGDLNPHVRRLVEALQSGRCGRPQ